RFTANIKKIEASTKIFGDTVKNTERYLAALEKEMVRLVANGLDPADAKIKEMKANYDKLSQSLNTSSGTLKESNKKWNALSLIVQDLPFGFRAIQNNLPALVGSFAAAGGAIYLAFSVGIAIATAFEKEISSLFSTVTEADRMQKTYNASIEAGQKAYTDAKTEVMLLNDQVKEAAGNKQKEKKAVDDYNDSIGKTLGRLNTFKEVQQSLINQGDAYVNFIFKVNMANAAAAKVAEESANMMIAAFKDPSKFIGTWDKVFSAQINIFGNLVAGAVGTAEELAKRGRENQQAAIKDAGLNAVAAEKVWNTLKEQVKDAKKDLKFGSFADPKDAQKAIKQQEAVNEKIIQDLIDAKKQEVKMVEDDAFAKFEVSKQLAQLEKRLALEKLKNAGYTAQQQAALEEGIYKEYANKIVLLDEAMQNQLLDNSKKLSDKKKKDKEKDLKESTDFAKKQSDNIKTQSDVEQKLYKSNLKQRQEALKANMAKLAVLAATTFDPKVAQVYLDMFDKLDAQLKGLGDNWKNTAVKINSVIQDFLANSFVSLGETIGEALSGKDVNGFEALGLIIADALSQIGKALISFAILEGMALEALKNPLAWPVALAAGIAAVAAGSLLKSTLSKDKTKKFANGGIISGPTMGLMGEYPGASSNPEVVAPLDKLKDMIGGGGGGTFVLKGQDLLLSVNRAQKASNIKGQNISLA
ncbi:MAG: hypothetical protein ACOVJ5_00610, partial [Gloeomargaritales cyanobacterium]